MKILYVSSAPSKTQFKLVQSQVKTKNINKIYGMPEASYKFHNLILDGLEKNNCEITSIVSRQISYKTHYKIIWRYSEERINKIFYQHLFLINLPVLKQLIACIGLFIVGIKWLIRNKSFEDKAIIIDGAYISFLPVINLMTKIIKCKKNCIVADIYSYMADVCDARKRKTFFHKIIRKYVKKHYQKIDSYIFLTNEMSKLDPFKNKRYMVMEGITSELKDRNENNVNKKEKYVMYAGALKKEYGIERLVKAFHKLKYEDIYLYLFGNGAYVDEIRKMEKIDSRIKYFGKKNIEEIIEYEKNAILLVNPRFTKDEFTKYSFPSKIIEYMSSGTPLLSSRLSGIPNEYYRYIFTIEGDDVDSLVQAFNKILKINKYKLNKIGHEAKKFIIENKNNLIQTKRILDFISNTK
jgi:glycosyltransferase involved in cell wall biosynthesis